MLSDSEFLTHSMKIMLMRVTNALLGMIPILFIRIGFESQELNNASERVNTRSKVTGMSPETDHR
jgi:hypothetical protein